MVIKYPKPQKNKKKVLFVGTGIFFDDDYPYPNHGGATQIINMATEMVRRGFEVYIAKRGTENSFKKARGVIFVNIKLFLPDKWMFTILNKLIFSFKVSKIAKRLAPDIIYLRDRFSAFFPSFLKIPSIYTLYSPDACDFYKNWSIKNKKHNLFLFYLKRWVEETVMKNVLGVIVLHNKAKDYLLNKGFKKIKIVPLGINFKEVPKPGSKKNFILYAGRLDWNKKVDVLIEAFSKLPEEIKKKLSLKIAGTGEKESQLRQLARKKDIGDKIEFLGWVDRRKLLKNYMGRAKVFVLPSQFENFPNTILEAMACSTPVIASDTRGARAIIGDGYNGLLFAKGNVKELKDKLYKLLTDDNLRKKLSKRAKKTVEQNYDIKNIAQQYLKFYRQLKAERTKESKYHNIGIVAPTPGKKEGESGHIATKMMVEIFKKFHHQIHIFTRDTFKSSFPEPNVYLHKIHKPFSEIPILREGLSFFIYQLKIGWQIIRYRKQLNLIIFGGWGLIIPLFVCRVFKIKTIQRVGGHPIKVLKGKSKKKTLFFRMKVFFARQVMKLGYSVSSYIAVITPGIIEFNNLQKYQDKIILWDHYYLNFKKFRSFREFKNRENIVGFIGIVSREKGVPQLIKSIPKILKEKPNLKFLIVGSGPYFKKAKEEIKEKNLNTKVEFTGYIKRDKIPAQLNRMRFLILPSRHEGLSKAILEAMACGTIPIASSVGGIPDIIKDGQNGFILAPDNSPQSIFKKIIQVLENKNLQEISKEAYQNARERYSFKSAVKRYKEKVLNCI